MRCLISAPPDPDPKYSFLADFRKRSIWTDNFMHSKTFLEFHKVMGRGQILLYHFARPIPLSLFFLCSYFSGVTSNPYSYPLEWTFYFQVKLSRYVSETSPVFLLRNSVADVVRQIFFLSLWNSVGLPYMTYGLRTSFVKGSVKGWDLKQWCYYLIYHKRNNIVTMFDDYSATLPLLIVVILENIAVSFVYGIDK